MSGGNYYVVLGVPESATQEEIRRAFRVSIRQVHPDHVPNASPYWKQAAEDKSKEINEAYRVLTSCERRSAYDEQLRRSRPSPKSQPTAAPTIDPGQRSAPYSQMQNPTSRKHAPRWRHTVDPTARWAMQYPWLAACLVVLILVPVVVPVVSVFGGLKQKRSLVAPEDGSVTAFPCLD